MADQEVPEQFVVKPVLSDVGEIIDVFFEEGWEHWTRFEVKRTKGKVFLTKLGGRPLTDARFKTLCGGLA